MKIELLKSQAVPCTRYTAFAGMRFEVSSVSRTRKGGVWIFHMGRSVFVPEGDYRDVSPVADFLERRACLKGIPYSLVMHSSEGSKPTKAGKNEAKS